MNWGQIASLVLNLVLSGGLVVTFVTLKSTKLKESANANKAVEEARADEIKNVESAIKIWREMAECMTKNYEEVSGQVQKLTVEVSRLNSINSRIMFLLDRINTENVDKIVQQIKEEINDNK